MGREGLEGYWGEGNWKLEWLEEPGLVGEGSRLKLMHVAWCRVGVRMSSAWNGVITCSYKELPGLCSLSVSLS